VHYSENKGDCNLIFIFSTELTHKFEHPLQPNAENCHCVLLAGLPVFLVYHFKARMKTILHFAPIDLQWPFLLMFLRQYFMVRISNLYLRVAHVVLKISGEELCTI